MMCHKRFKRVDRYDVIVFLLIELEVLLLKSRLKVLMAFKEVIVDAGGCHGGAVVGSRHDFRHFELVSEPQDLTLD